MVKKIIWTPEAEKSFEAVIDYLQKHWSQRELEKFIEQVNNIVYHITRHPLAYRKGAKDDIREALITKHNLLLYRILGETIYILYVWETRKNPLKKPV